MTIENIGGFVQSGNLERILDHGRIQGPITPEIQKPTSENAVADVQHSFSQMLTKTLEDLNDMQNQADTAVKELTAGRNKNIHETILLVEKADMNFRLAMQVRNKLIDAYREVMRMQV